MFINTSLAHSLSMETENEHQFILFFSDFQKSKHNDDNTFKNTGNSICARFHTLKSAKICQESVHQKLLFLSFSGFFVIHVYIHWL